MNDMHSISKKLGSTFLTTSRELFARQYAISDEETIEQGFWRSTEPFADNDDRLLLFQKIMEKKFCPGGRILAGAGTSHRNTLNCFVLAPNSRRFDYLDDVEDLVLKVAATTKVGGGIGINFDPFRSVQFAEPVDIEIYHTMDPNHPDYHDFVEWQYTDITAYGQPKRRFDRRGALIVDYSEREAMSAPIIVVDDSISAIFRAPFDAVRTGAKKVILDWSNLRAEGTPIKGSGGTSSGAASFAIEVQHIIHWLSLGGHTAGPINALRYVFQSVLRSVRQGGTRRGAGMATLSVDHPDAEIFLSCKDHDVEDRLGEISAFNISFLARDKDMDNPFLDKIAKHAWLTGDPGLLFVDTINRDNPLAAIDGYILSTNPCFTGDMRLLTEDGWITFKDAAEHGKPLKIIQDSRISYTGGDDELPSNWKIDPHNADPGIIQQASHAFLTKRNAEVVQLEFADGTTLRLTPDHLVATTVGMIEAQNLTEMHEVLIGNAPETESIAGQWPKTADEHMGFLMGLLASDGTYDKGKTTEAAMIDLFNEAMGIEAKVVESIEALWDVFKSKYRAHKRPFTPYSITRLPHKLRIKSSFLAAVLKGEYGFSRSTKSQVPKRLMENSRHKPALFYLAAFTYCDGTVNTHTSCRDIRINQSNKKLLEDIQLMLSGAGISSKVYLRRTARWKSMPDGKGGHKDYWTKDNYELVITKGRSRFLKIVGILRGTKQDKLEGIVKSIGDVDHKPETTYVLSITPAGREDVYCIHENVRRSLIVEKVCARRCGEIPLYPGEPCDLGAMNLLKYVTKNAVFNAESFANDVGLYVRYLDANLDYAILPTEQSRVMSQRNRRIGLGVMGLAHALIKLGLRYDSDAGRSAAWKMFRTMAVEADQESVNMSDGRQRMSIPFERKNIALLTVAPTGTTSMIMDVSSGIEPIFSVTYRRKIGSEDRIFLDPLLMEMLREHDPAPEFALLEGGQVDWDEERVVEAIQKNGGSLKGLSFIPKYMQDLFKTSHEIHYRDHIAMQAAAQDGMNYRHVGNSISKTINMPHSATVEDVLDAYRYAHSMGCKGITVYRDGSRSNQVLNTDTEVSLECPTGVCEL